MTSLLSPAACGVDPLGVPAKLLGIPHLFAQTSALEGRCKWLLLKVQKGGLERPGFTAQKVLCGPDWLWSLGFSLGLAPLPPDTVS